MQELRVIIRDKRLLISLICTCLFGIFAHGMVIFNNLLVHDALSNLFGYNLGSSYTSGRWAAELLELLSRKIYGTYNYTVPGYNFFISILFTAIMSFLIIRTLNIDNVVVVGLIASIAIVFPTITSLAGYIYTMPFSQLAFMLCTISVFIYFLEKSKIRIPFGILCAAFAIGVYQAVIPFMLTLFLLGILRRVIDEKYPNWKAFILDCVKILTYCISSLVLYLIFLKVSLMVHNAELTDYQGINTMTSSGIVDYLRRVIDAYKFFVILPLNNPADVFPFSLRFIHHCLCIVCIIEIIILIYRKITDHRIGSTFQIIVLTVLFPLICNFIYVMCDYRQTMIYSLMMYSDIFLFVLPALLFDKGLSGNKIHMISRSLIIILLSLSVLLYTKYDNVCYTKTTFLLEELKAYYTELKTRIESVEGYSSDKSIIFKGDGEKKMDNLYKMDEYRDIAIIPYFAGLGEWISNYNWYLFMMYWTGYTPERCLDEDTINSINTDDMPHYPDDGSIRIMDDIIVVNF